MNTKDQAETIEIMLKNLINMHKKVNLILDVLAVEENLDKKITKLPSDEIIKIDSSTYQQMCDLMEENVIPFMGIA